MSTNPPLPQKEDLPKEIGRVATTLSDEAQKAAIQKCDELGFDLNRGRIPLQETLINLSHSRDVLIDAAQNNKLFQLPLKLQHTLFSQTQKISEALTALVGGSDTLLILEDAVEDLTASIWSFNLHNLSDQILGFHTKMNQLKEQETLIRQAHRKAQLFEKSSNRANALLSSIEETAKGCTDQAHSIKSSVDQVSAVAAKINEQEQKVSALTVQVQQHDSTAAQFVVNAKNAAAEVEAFANKSRELLPEIETERSLVAELRSNVDKLLASTEKTVNESLDEFQKKYVELKEEAETSTKAIREKAENAVQELTSKAKEDIVTSLSAFEERSAHLEQSINQFISEGDSRLNKLEEDQESRFSAHTEEFSKKSEAELKQRVDELDELEGRIRKAIERATGYTLFHSFQKRQLDLAESKRFWGYALAGAVLASLCASGLFIWSLQYVQVYNAAFYLKLSISLPLIYAIAFCNVQYSRERRLEEEYAFKSSISISLDPYQKLVGELVDKSKPEELSKYTAFIIESVLRVFTSPTERVFGEHHPKDEQSSEKLIRAIKDLLDPIIKMKK